MKIFKEKEKDDWKRAEKQASREYTVAMVKLVTGGIVDVLSFGMTAAKGLNRKLKKSLVNMFFFAFSILKANGHLS